MTTDYAPVAQNRTIAKANNDLRTQIQRMEQHFQLAMPRGAEAKQLIRDALTCLRSNPRLAECEHNSVLGSLMTCAQLGLRPGVGVLGQAYLLPFWDKNADRPDGRGKGAFKAQLVIGYQGYVELAHRSGRIASIHARTVYENDYFELEYGAAEDKWVHRPYLDGPRGKPRLFYAVGRTVDGGYSVTDPVNVADMEAYRDRHATAKKNGQVFGPWIDHFEAMAHKTMVRRLMKLLPKSTEQQQAIAHDGGVRVDVTPDALNSEPDYVEGEVLPDELGAAAAVADSDIPAKSFQEDVTPVTAPPADELPLPPEPPAAPPADVKMASRQQITQLKQIRQAEKYDADEDWLQYVHNITGARAADKDLTSQQAQQIIDLFNGGQQ